MADIVILRRWKGTRGDLIALFPEIPADEYGSEVSSYMHVGQHGAANYEHVISQTKPVLWWANDEMDFLNELQSLGYQTDVRARRTPQMRMACLQEATRIRRGTT